MSAKLLAMGLPTAEDPEALAMPIPEAAAVPDSEPVAVQVLGGLASWPAGFWATVAVALTVLLASVVLTSRASSEDATDKREGQADDEAR